MFCFFLLFSLVFCRPSSRLHPGFIWRFCFCLFIVWVPLYSSLFFSILLGVHFIFFPRFFGFCRRARKWRQKGWNFLRAQRKEIETIEEERAELEREKVGEEEEEFEEEAEEEEGVSR